MKVLIIGQGGREHALAWKIKQSARKPSVYCAPGNAGMAAVGICVRIAADDHEGLIHFSKKEGIDLVVVGPEAPLVDGIVERFSKEGIRIFGPDSAASRLEGSKVFAKNLMKKLKIPTAEFEVFHDAGKALQFIADKPMPLVIKADGLAAGKGVTVAQKRQEAEEAVRNAMVSKQFGDAGGTIVIEECLSGVEVSLIAMTDGEHVVSLASSRDHKRAYDADQGPNTGGMGAYSPAGFVSESLMKNAEDKIFRPLVREFRDAGHPFIGFIYAGVMLTEQGLKVLEFNVRLGDPEAQAILPRLKSDLLDMILAACEGRLNEVNVRWRSESAACVVLASGGYPGAYSRGFAIKGLDDAATIKDTVVFHSGTDLKGTSVVTAGGRVLGVVGLGDGLDDALAKSYGAVNKISFDKMHYRKDIGKKAKLAMSRGEKI